jgi:hypothetical protein
LMRKRFMAMNIDWIPRAATGNEQAIRPGRMRGRPGRLTARHGDGPCRSSGKIKAGTLRAARNAASTGIAEQIDGRA